MPKIKGKRARPRRSFQDFRPSLALLGKPCTDSFAAWKGASGPVWDFIPHPPRARLRKSKALSPSDETRHCSQSWLPGQAEGYDNCSVGSGALFAYMQIGGLISCSLRWVSSGLGLTPAWPGLKASLASGTHAQPDGGLSRQGWPVALAAEGSSQDLNVLLGEPETVI